MFGPIRSQPMPTHRQASRVKRRVARGKETTDQPGKKVAHPGRGLRRSAGTIMAEGMIRRGNQGVRPLGYQKGLGVAIEPDAGGFSPVLNFLADEAAQLTGMWSQDQLSLSFFQPLRMRGHEIECSGVQDHRHGDDGKQSRKKIGEGLGRRQARANHEGFGLALKSFQVRRSSVGMGGKKQFR